MNRVLEKLGIERMEYWERVQAAMEYAGLGPTKVAAIVRTFPDCETVSQQTISQIGTERRRSSKYTVQIAIATGTRPEWLAAERGDMIDIETAKDPKLESIARDMVKDALTARKIKLAKETIDQLVDLAYDDVSKGQLTKAKVYKLIKLVAA